MTKGGWGLEHKRESEYKNTTRKDKWVRGCKSKMNYYYPQVCSPALNLDADGYITTNKQKSTKSPIGGEQNDDRAEI